MKGIQICPTCGQPTVKVKEETVKNLINDTTVLKMEKSKCQICVNDACETVYIKGEILIGKNEIKPTVFFKDKTDDALICYCYKISRGEIKEAVANGCKSPSEVYKYLNKTKKGSCETNNPMGKSCTNVFRYVLDSALKMQNINSNLD